jgi:hypothetical protein
MWRGILDHAHVTGSARVFAASVLAPMMSGAGRIRPGGLAELVRRYAEQRGRPGYTRRRIQQLLTELVRAGVLEYGQRPAPGRPASYTALVPGTDLPRPMLVRPRGIAPKRLLAAFSRERDEPRGPP